MTNVPTGVPTTCDFTIPHCCDEGDCVVCLCHIAKCKQCWAESCEELRDNARSTWLIVVKRGGLVDHDGVGTPITLEHV